MRPSVSDYRSRHQSRVPRAADAAAVVDVVGRDDVVGVAGVVRVVVVAAAAASSAATVADANRKWLHRLSG